MNLNIGCLTLRASERLMNHNFTVGQRQALTLGARSQQKRAHACRHTDTDGGYIRLDILHGIINCHAGCDRTARAVNVQGDVLLIAGWAHRARSGRRGRRDSLFCGPVCGRDRGSSSHLIYITKKNGGFFRNYGRVLHDQAITGVEPEGKLSVSYTEETYAFPDGEKYSLITPSYSVSAWYADSIAPQDLIVDVRIPLRHVGMGQMMALDPIELEELARRSNYPEYGISGRLNYITERGRQYIGVSGNKAQHADLTIELGFSSDLGVTNDRYPLEVAEGQSQMLGYSHYGIQISTQDMEHVDFYLHALGVPARRNVDDPVVQQGEKAFYRARCDLCHVPTLHTRQDAPALINGTRLPWLANQTIHPYSDFLLHDMGPDLDSHYTSGLAQGCEWRTTPLWGIGLQQRVNQHTYFLHDGRARNLKEAIMWHGGEGAVSRELFARMSRDDRDALIKFLESL